MKKSNQSKFGSKNRQLRFETMEERLYLSAAPNVSLPLADEIALADIAQSQSVGSYSASDDSVTQTLQTVGIRKTQDGLFNSEGEILQKLVFEFERTVDPDNPTALDQPLTIFCFYSVGNERSKTNFDYNENQYRTNIFSTTYAVYSEQAITFQSGETKAYWEIGSIAAHRIWEVSILPNGSGFVAQEDDSVDYRVDSQNGSSTGRVQLYRENVDQAAPTINISKVQDGILDTEGNWIQRPVFELERVIDPNAPESLQQPLTVDYVFFTKDAHYEMTQMTMYPGQEMSVTFQSGETKIQVSYDFEFDPLDEQTMYVDCVLADSLPQLNGGAPQYHIGANKYLRADVTIDDSLAQQTPTVNVKTIQEGAVSPNGQIQQSIVFEFERAVDENLNQALTIEYELYLYQGIATGYSDKIANQLDKPLTITFQPGETSARLEFSGYGYNEYKSATSLTVSLLGTKGEYPEVISENYYATAPVTLVNNPGELSIPKVSVKVVPDQTHGEKVVFEIERQVDPNNPHALNEPLEISYNEYCGGYSDCIEDRLKIMTTEYRYPKTIVFQPGQSKITLEFNGRPNQWAEIIIHSPTGGILGFDGVASPDYIVEQGKAEADFGLPCPQSETTPTVNVKTIQEGAVSPNGQIRQSIIFELERVIDPNDPDALNQALTIEYAIHFTQGFETDYYDKIAHLLNKPLAITFQPGETSTQLEFSELGYNEYKSETLIGVALLGVIGNNPARIMDFNNESPEVISSDNPYALAHIALEDNPGENSIPKVSVRVVPEQTHGEKVVFEIERQVDPTSPDAINEPLKIFYSAYCGGYSELTGITPGIDYTRTVVFQPGQTKITLEYTGSPDQWIKFVIHSPTGTALCLDEVSNSLVYQVNTSPDYIIEQGRAEADYENPSADVGTAPNFTISGPAEDGLFEKSSLWWKITAETSSQRPIMNWEINWGDGSENTRILGGPRNDILIPHHFRQAGTYTITVKTTDLTGQETTTTLGTYTVKPRIEETPAVAEEARFTPEDVIIAVLSLPEETPVVETLDTIQVSSLTAQESRTSWFNPVAQSASRIAEIDQYFQTEQTSNATNFEDEIYLQDLLFSEESNANALDAVFETDWDPFALTPLLPETTERGKTQS